jgi:formiminotetrahydrofolate cyclodeaminase
MGRKKYAAVEGRMRQIGEAADELRRDSQANIERDSAAFEAVLRALRLPQATEAERKARAAAVELAMRGAALVPLEVAQASARTSELAAELAETANVKAISDAASAVAFSRAALQAAALNVRINAASLQDRSAGAQWEVDLQSARRRIEESERRTQAAVEARAGLG